MQSENVKKYAELIATVGGACALLYAFASHYFVTVDDLSSKDYPTKEHINGRFDELQTAINNKVELSDFKRFQLERDIKEATAKIKLYDKIGQDNLTITQQADLEYWVEMSIEWKKDLSEL